jgi:hypothetical protein
MGGTREGKRERRKEGRIVSCVLLFFLSYVLFVVGCTPPPPKPLPICPGTSNAQEALQVLRARARQAVPFKVTGQCRLAYHVPDEKGVKRQSLSLPVVFFQPPSDVYIQGSVTANPKAVIVGSNDTEFWLAMRPEEISSYYWGRWDQAANAEGMLINPAIVLEAFGFLGHEDPNAKWSFEKQGPYDVLTRLNAVGQPARRLYIYSCDYLVHKMEHFGPDGRVVATAELKEYKPVTESFGVPTQIHVTTVDRTGREDTIDINLGTPKQATFSEAQRRLFLRNPGDVRQFKNVYRLENGYWVAQPQ